MTASALARALQVKDSSVSAWVHQRARPIHHLRQAIASLLDIPVDAWMTRAERKIARIERVPVEVPSLEKVAG